MSQPLLLQYYQLLPGRCDEDTPLTSKEFRKGLSKYKRAVQARYYEATLEKLVFHADPEVRQASVLALGLFGSVRVNAVVAKRLHDDDELVCHFAEDALWKIWFRADSSENNDELQRLIKLRLGEISVEQILVGFNALIKRAPRFAEAYNQRAIFFFKLGEYSRCLADCERVLRLNPFHFGAASGMGQCYMKQKKLRAALREYRKAKRIHPKLDGIKQAIESLERMLGEEGKR